MVRSVATLTALAGAFLAVPASADTPKRVGVDQEAQVVFSVAGRDLTVRLRPVDGAENPLASDVSGADVVFACLGRSPKDDRERIAKSQTVWPAGETEFTTRLSKDVSAKLRWCLMERPDGGDLAVARKMRIPNPAAATPQG